MFTSKCKIKTHLIYVHGSDPLKRGFSNFWKGLDNSDSGSCPEIFNRPPFSQVFHLRPKLLHMHTHIHNHSLFCGLHPHPAGQVLNKYRANGRRNGLPSELSITLLCRLGHKVVCWSLLASNCRVGLEPAKNLVSGAHVFYIAWLCLPGVVWLVTETLGCGLGWEQEQ